MKTLVQDADLAVRGDGKQLSEGVLACRVIKSAPRQEPARRIGDTVVEATGFLAWFRDRKNRFASAWPKPDAGIID